MLTRRSLFGGIAALLAAPAIVRVASIMPVRVQRPSDALIAMLDERIKRAEAAMADAFGRQLYGDGTFKQYSGYDIIDTPGEYHAAEYDWQPLSVDIRIDV